jgi:membrane dipeptidase
MVDVSHLSDAAFSDVCRAATRPFIASHSNCRAVCPHPRNLTDGMIRELAERGGVMGINLGPSFLDPESHRRTEPLWAKARDARTTPQERARLQRQALELPRPSLDWVARHVVHAIDVGGEDCVGIGGDLDGILIGPAEIDSVADYPKMIRPLREAGLSERQIEKVCCGNFVRAFSEILG